MTTLTNKILEMNNGMDPEKPMFPISIVADLLQVHQRTLRIYNAEEILVPQRSPKNRRLYSFNDIERGRFIQYLTRELGINLAGIKVISMLLTINAKNELDKSKLSHLDYLKDIAEDLHITPEQQADNRQRLSKRGRKAKNEQ